MYVNYIKYIITNMTDSWEDWENEAYIISVLHVSNPEQLKQLEDRKLVEDADMQIARDLFSNEEEEFALEENRNDNKHFYKKNIKSEKKVSNQKVNEQKQKEEAKFVKEENAKKTKAKELYGYTEYDDKYADYEDKFC
jgi:hypothetical protein